MPDWNDIDRTMTATRIDVRTLQEKMGSGAAEGAFHCSSWNRCEESLRKRVGDTRITQGDWTYVGHEYGHAIIRGKPARILFVSMERPKGHETDLEPFEKTQESFRESCRKHSNPHMGGVDTILCHLLDAENMADQRCQRFALTNSVRCAPITKDSNSRSTNTMLRKCQRHTEAIMASLMPDIVVTQGNLAYEGTERIVPTELHWGNDNGRASQGRRFAEVRRGAGILLLRTAHPARYPEFKWSKGNLPEHLGDAIDVIRDLHGTQDT